MVGKPNQLGKVVPKGWRELQGRLAEITGVIDATRQYGFFIPGDHILPLGRIATYISVEVAEDTPEPKGLKRHDFPASRYAQFEFVGSFMTPEFGAFYGGMFEVVKENELPHEATLGWIELYEDASHNWDDKKESTNRIRVLFPLRSADASA